jgi:hypothetical protein
LVVIRKSILVTSVLLLASFVLAVAEPVPFEINGELRVRNENDNRDFNSETGYKSFNLMRTRLGVSVQPASDMSVFVQMQDSRVQGYDGPGSVPGVQEDSRLDLHQGWFRVDNLGWQGVGIQAGRMEVRWGNERLVGVNDWDNVTRTFDGVMATYGNERVNLQALWANLQERDTPTIAAPETENSDATMQGGYGTIKVHEAATTDFFVINQRDKVTTSEDDDMNLLTVGGRLHGATPQRIDFSVEGAYQTGSQETGPATKSDIAAYMVGGEVGLTVGSEDRPVRFGAGVDLLSGDDNTADSEIKHFDTLFGDTHRFYGLMDMPQVLGSAGLRDVKVNVAGTLFRNENNAVRMGAEFHNLAYAEPGTGEAALGNEVDVHTSWAYRERFVPTLGVSAFLPGDAIPGPTPTTQADNSFWVYLQGVVSF